MMKKKLLTAVLTTFLVLSSAMSAVAADSKVVTFKGEAEKFVVGVEGNAQKGFTDMEPGESRELKLTLANEDSQEMKFYMSAEILDNIAEKADQNAVYNFDISKNGAVFFSTIIGGNSKNNISVGKEYLDGNNNILLDTLAKGEKDQISIALTLDGDSAGNAYMSQSGSVQLVFTASTPENETKTIRNTVTKYLGGATTNVVKTIKTGDTFSIGLLVVFGISLVAVIILLIARRKKTKEER
ncbi:MAG: LPXTG cell wall anchor domain-containing protein [Lachnospiraceae bacterium]